MKLLPTLFLSVVSAACGSAITAVSAPAPAQFTARHELLLSYFDLSMETDCNGGQYPTITIDGANLRIVNGLGSTESTNGLGNLILGYNEDTGALECRGGSHNIVAGTDNGYEGFAGVVRGRDNFVDGGYSLIMTGTDNEIVGDASAIVSGWDQDVTGDSGAILGGVGNQIADESVADGVIAENFNTIVGGYNSRIGVLGSTSNIIRSTIVGGNTNIITGNDTNVVSSTVVIGGEFNIASTTLNDNNNSVIVGGTGNQSRGGSTYANGVIVGGKDNQLPQINDDAFESVIVGGEGNAVTGNRNVLVGGQFNTIAENTDWSVLSGGFLRFISSLPGQPFDGQHDWVSGGLDQNN